VECEGKLYEDREVFPNAPLVFVTAEIRLAYEPDIVSQAVRDSFAALVRKVLPVLEQEIEESEPLVDAEGKEFRESTPVLRASSLDRKTSVTLSVHTLRLETVLYDEFSNFKKLLEVAVQGLATVAPLARVTRCGLRYIDEIRVPDVSESTDWVGWLSPAITGPLNLAPKYSVTGMSGALVVTRDDDSRVFVRWGDILGTTVLSPDMKLDVERPDHGRFFVYDVDSAWEPGEAQLASDIDVQARFDQLHEPVGVMFMSALTDKVKAIFRSES
jgi:uncharacterized protein (TIGR04255 family)